MFLINVSVGREGNRTQNIFPTAKQSPLALCSPNCTSRTALFQAPGIHSNFLNLILHTFKFVIKIWEISGFKIVKNLYDQPILNVISE